MNLYESSFDADLCYNYLHILLVIWSGNVRVQNIANWSFYRIGTSGCSIVNIIPCHYEQPCGHLWSQNYAPKGKGCIGGMSIGFSALLIMIWQSGQFKENLKS